MEQIKKYGVTILFCTIIGYIFCTKKVGMFLVIFLAMFPLFIYIVFQLRRITIKNNRKVRLIRMSMWIMAFSLGILMQLHYAGQWKMEGDKLIEIMRKFKEQYGHYPKTKDDIDLIDSNILANYQLDLRGSKEHPYFVIKKQPDYVFYYRSNENITYIFYKSPLTAFDTYERVFDAKNWTFHPS